MYLEFLLPGTRSIAEFHTRALRHDLRLWSQTHGVSYQLDADSRATHVTVRFEQDSHYTLFLLNWSNDRLRPALIVE